MQNKLFSVGIVGSMLSGKSTIANALIGEEVAPTDVIPTTTLPTYMRWGDVSRVTANFEDGSSKEITVDQIRKYMMKSTDESFGISSKVDNVMVYGPYAFLKNNLQVVDTPKIDTVLACPQLFCNFVPMLDVVVFVIIPTMPFSKGEVDFLRLLLKANGTVKIIFLINRMDMLSPEDYNLLIKHVHARISNALERMVVHDEIDINFSRINDMPIIGVSAIKALHGKKEGDRELMHESNFLAFRYLVWVGLDPHPGIL